jgi:hypothetical protein
MSKSPEDIQRLILDFFGPNNARQSVKARQIRSEFNLQVSVPVVSHFLDLLKENKVEKANYGFTDIFDNLLPSARVLDHFSQHFGFRLEDIRWNYDKSFIAKIVERTFDSLIGKIAVVLAYYGCDIVLLSGRPSSLKPLSDLFLKYYAVSPNRLISMSDYKIGTWYPFQDGRGYFKDAKSIVAVGAMIGNYAFSRGGLEGFLLNLMELYKKMGSTTEYFTETAEGEPFISPDRNNASLEIGEIPKKIWCRQLNTPNYPTRPFYMLDYNIKHIPQLSSHHAVGRLVNKDLDQELEHLNRQAPFKIRIERESYPMDKETLRLVSVENRNNKDLPINFFSLQVQSMTEDENYWLDSGEFINL